MQFFCNNYVYSNSEDILGAMHIIINSIIQITDFFVCPHTCFTSLYIQPLHSKY